ncbi:MAG: hypothetical protein H0X41_00480 [Chitinophagaceae bacterium]|nr:hypothetical protein [Chitinophagaceae bacterium]
MSYFQVAGRTGNFYWVEKEKPLNHSTKNTERSFRQVFEVYDSRMNLVRQVAGALLTDETVKEYLVAGQMHFDQLLLLAGDGKTNLLLKRFASDGQADDPSRMVDSLPFSADGTDIILLRSPGRSRIELIAFESRPGSFPRLYTILFDQDWNVLHRSIFNDPNITQPCIQNDLISFPVDDFDNQPVQLADNGDWLMSTPCRTGPGFLFFHFCADGPFSFQNIRLSPDYHMEDIALTVEHESTGASVGILSGLGRTSLKQLQVTHYSMETGRFDFDSSYFFNTLAGDPTKKHLSRETLMSLPARGFIFFKEYGRAWDFPDSDPTAFEVPVFSTGHPAASNFLPPMARRFCTQRRTAQPAIRLYSGRFVHVLFSGHSERFCLEWIAPCASNDRDELAFSFLPGDACRWQTVVRLQFTDRDVELCRNYCS